MSTSSLWSRQAKRYSPIVYDYRKMTPAQRLEAVEYRRLHEVPVHSLPHFDYVGKRQFFISASCYEHQPHIGFTNDRMTEFEAVLLDACGKFAINTYAWCVLPDHYHVLVRTECIEALLVELGLLHGRTSFKWNGEEEMRGRKVWFNYFDRLIKSHRHFWATVNYIHNNPIKHGYVDNWQDWLWSSAGRYLDEVGRERAMRIWREFPVLDYGKEWDL